MTTAAHTIWLIFQGASDVARRLEGDLDCQ